MIVVMIVLMIVVVIVVMIVVTCQLSALTGHVWSHRSLSCARTCTDGRLGTRGRRDSRRCRRMYRRDGGCVGRLVFFGKECVFANGNY